MFELSKEFRFEAAHTLHRSVDVDPSRRIHGHSFRAEVTVRGKLDPRTGMVIDLGVLQHMLAQAREDLDHRFLDEVPDLGPATLENLCVWIWNRVARGVNGLVRVTVHRDSNGERCSYSGPSQT